MSSRVLLFSFLLLVVIYQYRYMIHITIKGMLSPSPDRQLFLYSGDMNPANNAYRIAREEGGVTWVNLQLEPSPAILTNKVKHFPPEIFKKRGAVPSMLLDIAVVNPAGDSVFLQNLDERGSFNKTKAQYMSALTDRYLQMYRKTIRKELDSLQSGTLYNKLVNITWLLHFGFLPQPQDRAYISSFEKAFSDFRPSSIFAKNAYLLKKEVYAQLLDHNIKRASTDSIVGVWKEQTDMTREDMAVEISHNILAMTIQWFSLARTALEKTDIGDPSSFFSKNAFAPFVASLTPNGKRVIATTRWDGPCPYKPSKEHSRCPYNNDLYETNTGEIVPVGHTINLEENFMAFGKSYRRCPGEVLTHIFLEEIRSTTRKIQDPDMGKRGERVPWGFGTER